MSNLILIGMPGSGKTTLGRVLARELRRPFLDVDDLIRDTMGASLSALIDQWGVEGFRTLEENVNLSVAADGCVIATGGSVIYGPRAMEHLRQIGQVYYLRLSYEEVAKRLGDLALRGVSVRPGQTLLDLYNERVPLYEMYAHHTIYCDGKSQQAIVEEIAAHRLAEERAGRVPE